MHKWNLDKALSEGKKTLKWNETRSNASLKQGKQAIYRPWIIELFILFQKGNFKDHVNNK